nr:hypothetical protein Iba_chr04dCG4040 [Ipomoea batatas]GMC88339.1 hypothetical protein Iba_chr04eCG9180 [Ipomoea batatas]
MSLPGECTRGPEGGLSVPVTEGFGVCVNGTKRGKGSDRQSSSVKSGPMEGFRCHLDGNCVRVPAGIARTEIAGGYVQVSRSPVTGSFSVSAFTREIPHFLK